MKKSFTIDTDKLNPVSQFISSIPKAEEEKPKAPVKKVEKPKRSQEQPKKEPKEDALALTYVKPAIKDTRINFRVRGEVYRQAQARAKKEGVSLNDLIDQFLEMYGNGGK